MPRITSVEETKRAYRFKLYREQNKRITRILLSEKNVSNQKVAKEMLVDPKTVGKVIRNPGDCKLDYIREIASAYGLQMRIQFTRDGEVV